VSRLPGDRSAVVTISPPPSAADNNIKE
jgi:hypothetical protein